MLRISLQKHFIGAAFSYKMVFERIPGDMCSKTYDHIAITNVMYFFTWGTLFYVTLDWAGPVAVFVINSVAMYYKTALSFVVCTIFQIYGTIMKPVPSESSQRDLSIGAEFNLFAPMWTPIMGTF